MFESCVESWVQRASSSVIRANASVNTVGWEAGCGVVDCCVESCAESCVQRDSS